MSVEPSNFQVPRTTIVAVTDDERATGRAKLEDLQDRQKAVAALKEDLKHARELEAEAQAAVNSHYAEICDPQGTLGFGEVDGDGE